MYSYHLPTLIGSSSSSSSSSSFSSWVLASWIMAGMLPGVECARRRRLHQGGTAVDPPIGSRRSSFCLYASSHDHHYFSSNSMKRSTGAYSNNSSGSGLGGIAREAKERLDERLRTQRSKGVRGGHEAEILGKLQREIFCWKKKRWRWSVSSSSSSRKLEEKEDEDCVVCLEEFRNGDMVVQLPCAHLFHWSCVVPWVKSSSTCPCCRKQISPN